MSKETLQVWHPWGGKVVSLHLLMPGVVSIECEGHGGLIVDVRLLSQHLTPQQMEFCETLCYSPTKNGNVYFEEDCDVKIPLTYIPGLHEVFSRVVAQISVSERLEIDLTDMKEDESFANWPY